MPLLAGGAALEQVSRLSATEPEPFRHGSKFSSETVSEAVRPPSGTGRTRCPVSSECGRPYQCVNNVPVTVGRYVCAHAEAKEYAGASSTLQAADFRLAGQFRRLAGSRYVHLAIRRCIPRSPLQVTYVPHCRDALAVPPRSFQWHGDRWCPPMKARIGSLISKIAVFESKSAECLSPFLCFAGLNLMCRRAVSANHCLEHNATLATRVEVVVHRCGTTVGVSCYCVLEFWHP